MIVGHEEGIRFINLRLEQLYGPGDSERKFANFIVRRLLANVPVQDLTPGEQERDFIYVDDVVSAYLTVLRHLDALGPRFVELEVGTGVGTTIRRFVEMVHRRIGSKTHLAFGALPLRESEILRTAADTQGLRSLGWQPHWNLESGVDELVKEEIV